MRIIDNAQELRLIKSVVLGCVTSHVVVSRQGYNDLQNLQDIHSKVEVESRTGKAKLLLPVLLKTNGCATTLHLNTCDCLHRG